MRAPRGDSEPDHPLGADLSDPDGTHDHDEAGETHDLDDPDEAEPQRSPFPHPPWTVGLVLVAGVITLLFGVLVNPIWLLVGSPFVIVLVLWLWVRLFARVDDP